MSSKMKTKRLSSKDIPDSYRGHVTSTRIISNLYKFINYAYSSDISSFKRDYKKFLGNERNRRTENETGSKLSSLSQKLRGYNGRLLKLSDAEDIEKIFILPEACLISQELNQEVAYIFLDCSPRDALAVYEYLIKYGNKNDIIDECSLVSGNSDVFLRLYGTKHAIRSFLTDVLGQYRGFSIDKTKTHFSLSNEVWQKYPTKDNSNKRPKRPYWLPVDWVKPD